MVLGYGAYGRFKWTCMVYRCWEDTPDLSRWLLRAIWVCSASAAQIKQWKRARGEFDSHDNVQILSCPGFLRHSWDKVANSIVFMIHNSCRDCFNDWDKSTEWSESSSVMAGMIITWFTCDSESSAWRNIVCHAAFSLRSDGKMIMAYKEAYVKR